MGDRPPALFKYQSIGARSLQNLRDRTLWCSAPEDFNDPFDCRAAMPDAGFGPAAARALVAHYAERGELAAEIVLAGLNEGPAEEARITAGFQATIRTALEQATTASVLNRGVICLSESSTDLLMWSHYADGHRGMCLAFDAAEHPFAGALPVIYQPTLPGIDALRMIKREMAPDELAASLMLTKFSACSYEREWRILSAHCRKPLSYNPSALKAVYLGIETPDTERTLVESALGGSAVPVIQMRRGATGFAVEPTA